jgi:RNase adaptor protein for sRNA GlmZ degradation
MPCALYIRGLPGAGKREVSNLLVRDLGWPRVWVHDFNATYKAIGEYKVPDLTDKLMREVCHHLMGRRADFLAVRPSRQTWGMWSLSKTAAMRGYTFVAVKLTADRSTLVQRVTRRWNDVEFRITTEEALDEYLNARREEDFAGEHVIDTTDLTPEQVAGRVKGLLPK